MTESRRNARLIALCIMAFALLSPPLLSLFNVHTLVLGLPLLYGYIFLIWALVIVLVMLAAGSRPPAS